jgi:hypothetical protein
LATPPGDGLQTHVRDAAQNAPSRPFPHQTQEYLVHDLGDHLFRYRLQDHEQLVIARAAGPIFGPVIGDLIVQHLSWRWIFDVAFWWSIAFTAVAVVLALWLPARAPS